MRGRQPLASKERRVLDVNTLAIFLVDDHPGNQFVSPVVEEGLRGVYIPLLMDILPIRAYWIMTEKWGCEKRESAQAIKYFVEEYDTPEYYCLRKETIAKSFELAEKLNHDVYDCVYVAAVLQENASAIITTDTNFEKLCKNLRIQYINPVPLNVLRRFKEWEITE